jgi:DNA-binding NarL/FixJ family response regulator
MNNKDNQLRSILITDDHSVIRSTLREWLCEVYTQLVVYEASSGENALSFLESSHDPDLIVLDFHLPGMTGIETTREIKVKYPHIPVIILTIQEDRQYIERAKEAGAEGYVIKRKMYSDLLPAINTVLSGKVFLRKN